MAGSRTISGLRMTRRGLLAGTGAAAALVGLSAFPGAVFAEDTPVSGGILKVAFSADPAGFDPSMGPSGMSHVVIEQVYSTLMSVDPDAAT